MPNVTYYVVTAFVRGEDGELNAEPAMEAPSSTAAVSRARAMAARKAGVIAFSRTGDPEAGEFSDAVVLFRHGEVPESVFDPE